VVGGQARNIYRIIHPPASTATVTFYEDPGLTQEIGSTIYDPDNKGAIVGCSLEGQYGYQVSAQWPDLAPDIYSYWAKVDSDNEISEPNENDNVTTRGAVTVVFYPEFTFIPSLHR